MQKMNIRLCIENYFTVNVSYFKQPVLDQKLFADFSRRPASFFVFLLTDIRSLFAFEEANQSHFLQELYYQIISRLIRVKKTVGNFS
jgi:hypothetical protein